MLGEVYGWGGSLDSRDCSMMVHDIFACFGICLPKDTTGLQSLTGMDIFMDLTSYSKEEKEQICRHVVEKVNELEVDEVPIPIMHNIVESALEQVKPVVAKSYRDYRNYKQDFVQMLDEVYKKSQSIMYIGDKENSNTDSALVPSLIHISEPTRH